MPRPSREKTVAVLVTVPGPDRPDSDVRASAAELTALLAGLGIEVGATVHARRGAPSTLGEGKRAEVKARAEELGAELVVVDTTLEPRAHRDLERALEVEVMDRTGVVLRVFERRARTRLAQVDIELARLAYEIPRIRERHVGDDRVGGGGRGGRGHTNVELERQAMRERMAALERELAVLREKRETQAARRRELPSAALVGYTNAGKSSLLRALTGSDVLVEDALFATLDSTVRALESGPTRVLISDTVGFIRNLPHELVASFRSTLDEARDADLLLLVADASDPEWPEQLRVTRETLDALGVSAPRRVVLNKIDRLSEAERRALAERMPGAIRMSALDPGDVGRLREAIVAFFEREYERDVLVVPFDRPRLLADVRARARVLDERYDERGAVLAVRAPSEAVARWREELGTGRPLETGEDVLAAAKAYGLSLHADSLALDESGLDFRVLHAKDDGGRRWILRAPRRPEASAAAQREARVLSLVRGALPVAVPEHRLLARDLVAYPRLPGEPGWILGEGGAPSWAFDPAAPPEAFLASYARLIAALWAIDAERARFSGVPVRTVDEARSEMARAMDATRGELRPPEAVWARWQRWIEGPTWPARTAMVHGDLHPGHLLLDGDRAVIGVLDWTEACVSDPSIDLSLLYGCFGRAALDDVIARLEASGCACEPRLADHSVERWAASPVLAARWALDTGNAAAMEHARAHLDAIAHETA